ncbi:50S ribosomal protein L18 [Elusimicrobiota bacterium]
MKSKWERSEYRKRRTRSRIRKGGSALPRLSVHGSLRWFYAQVIDDEKGETLVSASSREKQIRGERKCSKNLGDAKNLGRLIAEKALKVGIQKVLFDRGSRVYHGRIKALAEAAREAGLKF